MTRLTLVVLASLLLSPSLSAQARRWSPRERAAALAGCYRMDWITEPAIQRRLPPMLRLLTSSAPAWAEMQQYAFGAAALGDSTNWHVRWTPYGPDSLEIVFSVESDSLSWRVVVGPKTASGDLDGRVIHYAWLPLPVDSAVYVDGVPIDIGPRPFPIWKAEVRAIPTACPSNS